MESRADALHAASLLAIVTGVAFTFRLRDDLALVSLAVLATLFLANFFTEAIPSRAANYVPVVYGGSVVVVCGTWLLRRRST